MAKNSNEAKFTLSTRGEGISSKFLILDRRYFEKVPW